jgi:hypothetical protein
MEEEKKKQCFVIMPYDDAFWRNYYCHIMPVVESFNINCLVAEDKNGNGLLDDILLLVKESHYIIADISVANSNVMLELGMAYMYNELSKKDDDKKRIILLKRSLGNSPCTNNKKIETKKCWYRKYWNEANICSDLSGQRSWDSKEEGIQDILKTILLEKETERPWLPNANKWRNTRWEGEWQFTNKRGEDIQQSIEINIDDNNNIIGSITATINSKKQPQIIKQQFDLHATRDKVMLVGKSAEMNNNNHGEKYNYDLMRLKHTTTHDKKEMLIGKVSCNDNPGAYIRLKRIQ